jgi:hypothetical protein
VRTEIGASESRATALTLLVIVGCLYSPVELRAQTVTLSCNWQTAMDANERTTNVNIPFTLIVDLGARTVNGMPAAFSGSTVTWRSGFAGTVADNLVNRSTGLVRARNTENGRFNSFFDGSCAPATF